MSRRAQTVVLVTVRKTGISTPSFAANTVNIVVSEGSLSGASVYQSDANDPDGDALTYSMVQIQGNQNQFTSVFTIAQGCVVWLK